MKGDSTMEFIVMHPRLHRPVLRFRLLQAALIP
jgi:hypothetical protein